MPLSVDIRLTVILSLIVKTNRNLELTCAFTYFYRSTKRSKHLWTSSMYS